MKSVVLVFVCLFLGSNAIAEKNSKSKMVKEMPSKFNATPEQEKEFNEWLKSNYSADKESGFVALTTADPNDVTASLKMLNCDIQTSALESFISGKQFKYKFETSEKIRSLKKYLFCAEECMALKKEIEQRKANSNRAGEIINEVAANCSKKQKTKTPRDINHGASQEGIE